MSDTGSILNRDLFILEDERNPFGSKTQRIQPSTILDQVVDDQDPAKKNLRTIINEIWKAIETGGEVVINFPVTSVNGKRGDVVITKDMLGLNKVDNTSDNEKPLSDIQRETVMKILEKYVFDIDLHDLYDHINNTNNPHAVTIEQLNDTGAVTELIQHQIANHNNDSRSHENIKAKINSLSMELASDMQRLDERINAIHNDTNRHYEDQNAHSDIMDKKENVANKIVEVTDESTTYSTYPSTRAMVEYVATAIVDYMNTHKQESGIEDIIVIQNRSYLPAPTSKLVMKAYFILVGENGAMEVAVCRTNGSEYYWDFSDTGLYSNLDRRYFNYDENGLTIKPHSIGEDVMEDDEFLAKLKELIEMWAPGGGGPSGDYYTKEEIDAKHFISAIGIKPGTTNGTLRFYINDDLTTMSDDIHVAGLKSLAYKDKVIETDIEVGAVHADHIQDNAIENRHMSDKSVNASNMTASYMRVFGNVSDDENKTVQEITLRRLAELFAPTFREILEETPLIQITEQTVRKIAREEVRVYDPEWIDNTKTVNFLYDRPDLFLQYDADMGGDPVIYIDNEGQLCMDVDETDKLSIVERDLEHFEFYTDGEDLYVKVRSDEPDPEE